MCSVDSVRFICQPTMVFLTFETCTSICNPNARAFITTRKSIKSLSFYHHPLIEKPFKLDPLLTGIKKSHNLFS